MEENLKIDDLKIDDLTDMKKYLAFIKEKKEMITNIKTDNIKIAEIEKIFRKKFEKEILQSIYKKKQQQMSKTDIQAALNANEFIKACQDKWDDIIEPTRMDLANALKGKNLITDTVSNVLAANRLANVKRLAAAAEQQRLADAAEQQRLAEAAEQQRLADEAAEQQRIAAALAGQNQKVNRSLKEASKRKDNIDGKKRKEIDDRSEKEAKNSLEARDRRIALQKQQQQKQHEIERMRRIALQQQQQQQHKIESIRKNSNASAQKPFSVPHVPKGGSSKTKKTHKNIEKNITRKKTYKPA